MGARQRASHLAWGGVWPKATPLHLCAPPPHLGAWWGGQITAVGWRCWGCYPPGWIRGRCRIGRVDRQRLRANPKHCNGAKGARGHEGLHRQGGGDAPAGWWVRVGGGIWRARGDGVWPHLRALWGGAWHGERPGHPHWCTLQGSKGPMRWPVGGGPGGGCAGCAPPKALPC